MDKDKIESYVHYAMALTGGFFGGYALLNFHDLFGSAQTSNMIHMAMLLVGHNAPEFALRLLTWVVYVSGFVMSVLIPRYTKADVQVCSIGFNALAVIILCIIPVGTNDFIALLPVFFVTAFQWSSFKGAQGFTCSSIFSTNNLKQFTTSLTEYLCDKDKEHLKKTKFFGSVLLSYHIGVIISYLACRSFATRGAWFNLFAIALSFGLICVKKEWIAIRKHVMEAGQI